MAHEHGNHQCYCPSCSYIIELAENDKCNTHTCPVCGDRMRAFETGEYRLSQNISLEGDIIKIDDQPIDATFFGEFRRLTDWITPDALEVQELYSQLTDGIVDIRDKITACWKWVGGQIRYVEFVKGKLCIAGQCFSQNDLWQDPSMVINTRVGNCANAAMLLTSLVRNGLSEKQAYCVLGNLYSPKPGGHAWVKVTIDGEDYILEATTNKAPGLVSESAADLYEPVHYFNDGEVLAVEGRTQMIPYAEAYSEWLSDYLHFAYIKRREGP